MGCLNGVAKLAVNCADISSGQHSDVWETINSVLFGLPATSGSHAASEVLRRFQCLRCVDPSICPSVTLLLTAARGANSSGVQAEKLEHGLGEKLDRILRQTATSCGVHLGCLQADVTSDDVVETVRNVHAACSSTWLVPVTLTSWGISVLADLTAASQCIGTHAADEYVIDGQ